MLKTILLLVCSNVFMTLAWYGQLRLRVFQGKALWVVILMSWGIAFFEYCLMVPANRNGYAHGLSGYHAGGHRGAAAARSGGVGVGLDRSG